MKGDDNISPSTLKLYIVSIQRVLKKDLLVHNLDLIRILGLTMVVDNRFRDPSNRN